jgi:hypothetical protein
MAHFEKIVNNLNEAKSNLLNQIDHLQLKNSEASKKLILEKRKALLKIEVGLEKIRSQSARLLSKKSK